MINQRLDVRVGYAVRIMKFIHFKEISKRKLESTLEKFFQDRNCQWQVLRKIIVQENIMQTGGVVMAPRINCCTLLNSR